MERSQLESFEDVSMLPADEMNTNENLRMTSVKTISYQIMKLVGMKVPRSIKTRKYLCSKQRMRACNNNSMHSPIKYKM